MNVAGSRLLGGPGLSSRSHYRRKRRFRRRNSLHSNHRHRNLQEKHGDADIIVSRVSKAKYSYFEADVYVESVIRNVRYILFNALVCERTDTASPVAKTRSACGVRIGIP